MRQETRDLIMQLREPLAACCPSKTGDAYDAFAVLFDDARMEAATLHRRLRNLHREEDPRIAIAFSELATKLRSLDYHLRPAEEQVERLQAMLSEIKREMPRILDEVEVVAEALDTPPDDGRP